MISMLRAGAMFALIAAPAIAAAQSTNNVHFNIAAGVTFPTSDYGDRYDNGYNLVVGVGMQQRNSPLGFRAEGLYNEFSAKCGNEFGNCSGKAHAGGVTGNLTFDVLQPSRTQSNTLYLIGGVGYYSTKDAFSVDSRSDIGYNIGGGFAFPLSGFSPYIEVRYHTISNASVSFVPISFGLRF